MSKYQNIKKACEITDTIFNEIVDNFDFKTEKDIESYILKRFRDFKVKKAYPPIAANNNSVIHAKPRNKKLKNGFLILDFAAKYNGYCADMTRTLHIGMASAAERKLYNLVRSCQQRSLASVKTGINCCDLDVNARVMLGKYKRFFSHSLGHGIGRKIHMDPKISPASKDVLKKTDIITIEPGIYIKEKKREFGIRIEDTVDVASRKPLTTATKKLLEVVN